MSDLEGLEEALVAFIRTEVNTKVRVTPTTDLLAGEVLDSLGILAVIGFVEDRFGFEIDSEEVSLDSFRTVAAIRSMVAAKLST